MIPTETLDKNLTGQAVSLLKFMRSQQDEDGIVQIDKTLLEFQEKYIHDPVGFVQNCITFPPGHEPAFYQLEALERLQENKRLAVRGPHGLGKTALASWAIHWFALTRDGAIDWKIPCTASVWRQLTKFLFPEVHKWARYINWDIIGRENYNKRLELKALSLKLGTGEAFAITGSDAETIEGAHATDLMYIFDESKIVPDPSWDSAEGAFSTGNPYWLAISTPGAPNGRFYSIHSGKSGYEDWDKMHVTLEMAVRADRITVEWATQRKKQWGEGSSLYKNRVLGEFATSEQNNVISLELIERAMQNWKEWKEIADPEDTPGFRAISLDVGRGGDASVICSRAETFKTKLLLIDDLQDYQTRDVMKLVGHSKALYQSRNKFKTGRYIIVDVIGIGAGVVDRLRELKYKVKAFNASSRTTRLDKSGGFGFVNHRAACWWHFRELLEANKVLIPPNDVLLGELVSPTWQVNSAGKIQIEGKQQIRNRIGRSTDYADSVIMCCWDPNIGTGLV